MAQAKVSCPFCGEKNVKNNAGGQCQCDAEYWLSPDAESIAIIAANMSKDGCAVTAQNSGKFTFFKTVECNLPVLPPHIVTTLSSEGDFPFSFDLPDLG